MIQRFQQVLKKNIISHKSELEIIFQIGHFALLETKFLAYFLTLNISNVRCPDHGQSQWFNRIKILILKWRKENSCTPMYKNTLIILG